MKRYLPLLISLSAAWHLQAAYPAPVILPGGSEVVPGNSYAFEPFSGGLGGTNSIRYQQVFASPAIPPLEGAEAFLISGMVFRTDEGMGYPYHGSSDFQVNLSTTSRGPDALSTVFAENAGPDDAIVYPRSSLYMIALQGGYSGPIIQFSEPFYYDSRLGNLLLDVRYYSGDALLFPFAGLDAVDTANDATSRVFAYSVNAASGAADTTGIVVGFYVTPIPEPATWALLACGAAFGAWVLRRRSQSAK